ncbi:MAG: LexA family transcriptional regulator [Thermoprotei archaeon]|nr:MAG: LexA family transcriptional regulator [Thermoprotei archaeon]RLF17589.1 MAG: LexA family transcriptional regulator [Thermoprotei archaeon]
MTRHQALSGTTLKVYIALLRAGRPLGVREVQRSLGFRSPSTALYHLNKLVEMGYVAKAGDGYEAVAKEEAGVLALFDRVGTLLVPRLLFYALFFTFSLIGYFYLTSTSNLHSLFHFYFAFSVTAVAAALMWYEAVRLWRKGLKA